MNDNDPKSTLAEFMEAVWNNGDFSQIEAFLAPKYEVRNDPGDPWDKQTLTLATFQHRVSYSRNAFPDLRFEITDMIAEADKVAVSWTMSGTHMGDLLQLPATGRPFSITGMTIYYFCDGKICGHTQAYDRLGFLSQIGVLGE